jgi:hypothetical protein
MTQIAIVLLLVVIFSFCVGTNSFTLNNKVKSLKVELLDLSRSVARGLKETPEDRTKILNLFEKIEKLNKSKSPLKQPSLADGIWKLEYTTSDSILGRKSFKKEGDIKQIIDTKRLYAENQEVVSYFGFKVPRKVTAELTPMTASKVAVQFKVFSIGPISFNAPASARGELDITYVDENLRLSRGDKGNIFVLTRLQS